MDTSNHDAWSSQPICSSFCTSGFPSPYRRTWCTWLKDCCLSRSTARTLGPTLVSFLFAPTTFFLHPTCSPSHCLGGTCCQVRHLPVSVISLTAFSLKQENNLLKFNIRKQMKISKATPVNNRSQTFPHQQQAEFEFWHKMPTPLLVFWFVLLLRRPLLEPVILAVHKAVKIFLDNSI